MTIIFIHYYYDFYLVHYCPSLVHAFNALIILLIRAFPFVALYTDATPERVTGVRKASPRLVTVVGTHACAGKDVHVLTLYT